MMNSTKCSGCGKELGQTSTVTISDQSGKTNRFHSFDCAVGFVCERAIACSEPISDTPDPSDVAVSVMKGLRSSGIRRILSLESSIAGLRGNA